MNQRPKQIFALALLLAGCSGEVYVRDGVTDGDTFYLAPTAFASADPALQSWVTYSLMRSACQLEIGGPNPARASSFACELKARDHLVTAWREQKQQSPQASDDYLDNLQRVAAAGFLPEYVVRYFKRDGWRIPSDLDIAGFKAWRRTHLRGHRPRTRLIGSWGYSASGTP